MIAAEQVVSGDETSSEDEMNIGCLSGRQNVLRFLGR